MVSKPTPRKSKPNPAPRKSSPKTELALVKKDVCFVIMPFGGWFDEYFLKIYKPAIEQAGLAAHRADDLYTPSTITSDIWKYTQEAVVILADLTGKNPNVFYELGLAHALAKPAVMITQSMDDVPFDLRSLRIILYDKNEPSWGDVLQDKIVTALAKTIEAPKEAILPTFLSVRTAPKLGPVSEQEKQVLELKRELDLLRNLVVRTSQQTFSPAVSSSAPPITSWTTSSQSASMRPPLDSKERLRLRMYQLVKRGATDDIIVERLQESGYPKGWIKTELDKLRFRLRNPSDSENREEEP